MIMTDKDQKRQKKTSLIFTGGGARGAYQLGAWKAIKDMQLDRDITSVYGTSVGAINGAAFVQDDFQLASSIWLELSAQKVFADSIKIQSLENRRQKYLQWMKGAIQNRGLDVSPLKEILRNSIDESLIRKSSLDFGIVVFDLTKRRPRYLKKADIPQGKLVEYIIASATFPIFRPHKIEDNIFIDGGVYDNRPIGFLKNDHQAERAIVIDVTMARLFWPNKRLNTGQELKFVRPSKLLGSPLAFDKERLKRNFNLGYEDTRKQLATLVVQ